MSEITVEELSNWQMNAYNYSDVENTGKNKGERGQKVEEFIRFK